MLHGVLPFSPARSSRSALAFPAHYAAALLGVAPGREFGALVGAVEHHDEGVIAEARVPIVESLDRYAGPVFLPERTIDDRMACRERRFNRCVDARFPARVFFLVMKVAVDHDSICLLYTS